MSKNNMCTVLPPGSQEMPTSGSQGQRWNRNLQLQECRHSNEDESEINDTSVTEINQMNSINTN